MPGRCSSEANETPTSTISQLRLRSSTEPVDREVHADLADAAERREDEFAVSSFAIDATCRHERRRPRRSSQSSRSEGAARAGRARPRFRSGRCASPSGTATLMSSPTPAARSSQSARIAAKPAPRSHCASRFAIAPESAANNLSGEARSTGRGEIGRREIGAGGMMRAIDADADHDGHRPRLRSGCRRTCSRRSEDRSAISAEAASETPGMRAPTASCSASAATNDSSARAVGRRRIGQQQARVEIAGLGHPGAAAPAAPCGLASCGDPERAALAGARERQAFRVGRADRVVADKPRAGCRRCGVELHLKQRFRRRDRGVQQRRRIDEEQQS